MMEKYPDTNIIFTGNTTEFMQEAFNLHVSGFLLKPFTVEQVRYELTDLRKPVSIKNVPEISVQCFGNFELYIDGNPVHFTYKKTKEMLAYLIDRKGSRVSGDELIAVLWEDDSGTRAAKSYLRNLWADLRSTFEKYGTADMLVKGRNSYAVRPEYMKCDYYEYERGREKSSFNGEYMSQYSWAEFQIGRLEGGL